MVLSIIIIHKPYSIQYYFGMLVRLPRPLHPICKIGSLCLRCIRPGIHLAACSFSVIFQSDGLQLYHFGQQLMPLVLVLLCRRTHCDQEDRSSQNLQQEENCLMCFYTELTDVAEQNKD